MILGSGREVAQAVEGVTEVAQALSDVNVRGAKLLAADGEGLPVTFGGPGMFAALGMDGPTAVETPGDVEVVRTERLAADSQCLPHPFEGPGQVAALLMRTGEVVQNLTDVGVVRAERPCGGGPEPLRST